MTPIWLKAFRCFGSDTVYRTRPARPDIPEAFLYDRGEPARSAIWLGVFDATRTIGDAVWSGLPLEIDQRSHPVQL